jgi:hypothetical protein
MPIVVPIAIPFKVEALLRTCPGISAAETEEQIMENQMCFGQVLVQ